MTEKFIEAIKAGDTATVANLLQESPNIIRETNSPVSPIMLSMYFGQRQVAELLVQSGVTLTLHEAAVMGKLERVQEIPAEGVIAHRVVVVVHRNCQHVQHVIAKRRDEDPRGHARERPVPRLPADPSPDARRLRRVA